MTHHLTTIDFSFQNHTVRIFPENGETWFVAKDIYAALEIAWRGEESLSNIPANWRGGRKLRTPLQNQHGVYGEQDQDFIIINEPAVYKLAFRSNKPAADAFTNWVVSEVLPAIRQTGRYEVSQQEKRHAIVTEHDDIILARGIVEMVGDISDEIIAVQRRLAAVERLSNKFINSMTVLRPDLFTRLRVDTVRASLEERMI